MHIDRYRYSLGGVHIIITYELYTWLTALRRIHPYSCHVEDGKVRHYHVYK